MITANWHNKNTITAAAKATALVAKYMLLSSTQQIQHPDSYVLPVPVNKLPPATSYRLHREQGDQAHRQAEIQNDEVQRGRDDCCDPDLSHPPAKDEADASESRVVQPNYILQTTAAVCNM